MERRKTVYELKGGRENLTLSANMETFVSFGDLTLEVKTEGKTGTRGDVAIFSLKAHERNQLQLEAFNWGNVGDPGVDDVEGFFDVVSIKLDDDEEIEDLIKGLEFISEELRAQRDERFRL